jgi:hypothetical protein
MSNCEICGEPMPPGEEMFKFHGYSCECPKPPLKRTKFRKKPVVIDAIQFTGHNLFEVAQFAGDTARRGPGGPVVIRTLEGEMTCSPGDWIIRGVKGEFYPCKPDIFAATYDPA